MKISIRFEVFKRDAFTCRYCGKKSPEAILEVDHVVPLSGGGTDDIENLVTACYECNRGKGARLLTDIPPEENLHEKAILIAEQELQISELQHWRMKQREREDREINALWKMWTKRFSGHYWKASRVRNYLRKLGYVDVAEVVEYTIDHARAWKDRGFEESGWILFCSICSKHLGHSSSGGQSDAESDY